MFKSAFKRGYVSSQEGSTNEYQSMEKRKRPVWKKELQNLQKCFQHNAFLFNSSHHSCAFYARFLILSKSLKETNMHSTKTYNQNHSRNKNRSASVSISSNLRFVSRLLPFFYHQATEYCEKFSIVFASTVRCFSATW